METLYESSKAPKTLLFEKTEDGRLRIVIGLKKLGQETLLEYFLEQEEVTYLVQALGN